MSELTPRQASVLSFVEKYFRQHQQPPTEREIAAHFGINQSAARKHLKALERKGRLTMRHDGRSRGIHLSSIDPSIGVPIVGTVRAGTPLLAEENLEGKMMLDLNMVGTEQTFLLRVKGDSMIEAGIFEDDLLLVRRADSVRSGEIVVARIGDETTVKRFYDIAGRIFLEPANKNYTPIMVEEPEDFHLEGRVVALIRDMRNLEVKRKTGNGFGRPS
jgi:repressor LexA